MLIILGYIFLGLGGIILFSSLLAFYPKFRNIIKKFLLKISKWLVNNWMIFFSVIVLIAAIIMKDITLKILSPFSELAIAVLGLCILIGAIWKKALKHAWRIGMVAIFIIIITIIFEKLPW